MHERHACQWNDSFTLVLPAAFAAWAYHESDLVHTSPAHFACRWRIAMNERYYDRLTLPLPSWPPIGTPLPLSLTAHTQVCDFGLARFLDGTGQSHVLCTRAGTAVYMAPEVVSAGILSREADVYSCGVMLWVGAADPDVTHSCTHAVLYPCFDVPGCTEST